ncbi:unnamed protein product [Rotaria socialis]|uniref:Uncharacterized protein n=1 Tax=Rotaria socialis TaxID=392032 RepID=A0A818JX51_9BILA|nr:unnamed protein product [Rotaria socialis]
MSTLHYCENIQSEIALYGISTKKKIYFYLNLQDENNLVIKITDVKNPFYYFFTSINDIELQHYANLLMKKQNQGIETENVQISQTTAPPPTTTIHDRNDYDIDRKSWFSMVCQRVAGWFPITDKHVKLE